MTASKSSLTALLLTTLCVLSSRFAAAAPGYDLLTAKRGLPNLDLFRSKFCYMEQTDASLLRHIITLKSIYEKYSELNDDPHNKLQHRRLMSCGEWITLVEHLGFIASGNQGDARRKMHDWSGKHTACLEYSAPSRMPLSLLRSPPPGLSAAGLSLSPPSLRLVCSPPPLPPLPSPYPSPVLRLCRQSNDIRGKAHLLVV